MFCCYPKQLPQMKFVILSVLLLAVIQSCIGGRLVSIFDTSDCSGEPIAYDYFEEYLQADQDVDCTKQSEGVWATFQYGLTTWDPAAVPTQYARVAADLNLDCASVGSNSVDLWAGTHPTSDRTPVILNPYAVKPSLLGTCIGYIEGGINQVSFILSGCDGSNSVSIALFESSLDCTGTPSISGTLTSECTESEGLTGLAACENEAMLWPGTPVDVPVAAPAASPAAGPAAGPAKGPGAAPTSGPAKQSAASLAGLMKIVGCIVALVILL